MLNTRVGTVEGIETVERAQAIADTYERNGYTVGIYQMVSTSRAQYRIDLLIDEAPED